jgi:hypothetical protein
LQAAVQSTRQALQALQAQVLGALQAGRLPGEIAGAI